MDIITVLYVVVLCVGHRVPPKHVGVNKNYIVMHSRCAYDGFINGQFFFKFRNNLLIKIAVKLQLLSFL
jgi:hypothetical protein